MIILILAMACIGCLLIATGGYYFHMKIIIIPFLLASLSFGIGGLIASIYHPSIFVVKSYEKNRIILISWEYLPNIISFLFVCAISWFPGSPFVQWLIKKSAGDIHFRPLSGKVGTLECIIYIYSVIIGHYSIISGWLVLKSFYGWVGEMQKIESTNIKYNKRLLPNKLIDRYQKQIIGNAYSILLGILLGRSALFLNLCLDSLK